MAYLAAILCSGQCLNLGTHSGRILLQEKEGLRADTYTYSLLMNGYAAAKQPDIAMKLVGPSLSIPGICACNQGNLKLCS